MFKNRSTKIYPQTIDLYIKKAQYLCNSQATLFLNKKEHTKKLFSGDEICKDVLLEEKNNAQQVWMWSLLNQRCNFETVTEGLVMRGVVSLT